GPLRSVVDERIQRLDLRRQVRVTGFMSADEVRRELSAARALVLPSFAEGLPGVIIEAFALGRPAISTYIAGTPEIVQPGISGWLVPAGATELLADAMAEALAADPADLERMGRAGAARVCQQHNAAIEGRKLETLFHRHMPSGRESVASGTDIPTA
ncbi:MAG TPA: glycosyltransferase, partial [Vicinamibacterales bacterium]|nr:glycosyltransferase [Vicinamibacterales bacterium]